MRGDPRLVDTEKTPVKTASCEFEQEVRLACQQGELARAAASVLDQLGPELRSFLVARLRSEPDGEEVFSIFAEKLWRGLPTFAFRSSVRTWAYALARNAAHNYVAAACRDPARHVTLDKADDDSELRARTRTRTEAHRRTETKVRIRGLRDRLSADDRMLLVLRVDRDMAWRDLAQVLLGDANRDVDDHVLNREASRLRKRFERVKTELRRMAREEGLLDS